jgi:hypothetical protein
MADETRAAPGKADDVQEKLGRQLFGAVLMLMRAAKMYAPDNSIFGKPLQALETLINQGLALKRPLTFQLAQNSLYVDGTLVRVDLASRENLRAMIAEMKGRSMGGFTIGAPVTVLELQRFVWHFSSESKGAVPEAGMPGHELASIRIVPWTDLHEQTDDAGGAPVSSRPAAERDPAVLAYARAVLCAREAYRAVAAGQPPPLEGAGPAVQDLVDAASAGTLRPFKSDDEYLVFHAVNTAVLAIRFGHLLGLGRPELRDLGIAALCHDLGKATLPEGFGRVAGPLSADDRRLLPGAHLKTLRMLFASATDEPALGRLVAVRESALDFGTALRDGQGRVRSVEAGPRLSLFARLLAICSVYDALTSNRPFRGAYRPRDALAVMWYEARQKFDPELLVLFRRLVVAKGTGAR